LSGPSLGVRSANAGQDAREVIEGEHRIFHIAERDVTQQKLRFGKSVAFDQAMLLDEAIR